MSESQKRPSAAIVPKPAEAVNPEAEHSRAMLSRLEGDPEKVLAFAQQASRALVTVISQKPRKVVINGEQYLEFEDWQTVARFYGVTVGTEWTRPLKDAEGKTIGYEAKANALRQGELISSAEAACFRDEPNWQNKAEFQLRSMAQTRACAKALRNVLAWVVVLAGYKATPAEEMEGIAPNQQQGNQVDTRPATPKQMQFIKNLCKQKNVTSIENEVGVKVGNPLQPTVTEAKRIIDALLNYQPPADGQVVEEDEPPQDDYDQNDYGADQQDR